MCKGLIAEKNRTQSKDEKKASVVRVQTTHEILSDSVG